MQNFYRIAKVICPDFYLVAIKFMHTELTDLPGSTSLTDEYYGKDS